MNLTSAELRKLVVPLVLTLALLAAGTALLGWMKRELVRSNAQLAAAKTERNQSRGRLARISDEEREVKERMEVYQQLDQAGILGEEHRLEWADAIAHIRTTRELLDLRYRIEPQKPLVSVPGKPANVDFFASTMKVDIALLHEGDLLAFLRDLRDSGNQYTAVQRCNLVRSGASQATLLSLAPHLRAQCEIHLITIIDRAAKPS
jgi:hypothetical protein